MYISLINARSKVPLIRGLRRRRPPPRRRRRSRHRYHRRRPRLSTNAPPRFPDRYLRCRSSGSVENRRDTFSAFFFFFFPPVQSLQFLLAR
ncbi:hypothetical protein PUN28_016679 [Cardiocondyla obscurior]|uniref:Uncharacterized protein n=1 Tax=Cardiocondyla obscurior TaxID=286306 RepID=A0AAW2ES11_9HYME